MKWLVYYDRSYFENINYYDLIVSIFGCLKEITERKFYVEVKVERYLIRPIDIIILGLRDGAKSLRTQYQVQNDIQIE